MTHAFLQPSSASAWSRCALSATMNAKYPQDDSPSTIEGTVAHWVAWELLAGRTVKEGHVTHGISVTDEMLDGADLLIETILKRLPSEVGRHIEMQLRMPMIHPTQCFGTPDVWGFHVRVLHIIDYKFGHRFVDEYFNPQLLLYVLGAMYAAHGDAWHSYMHQEIELTIVQPRCFYKGEPVRSHRFMLSDAFNHFGQLQHAAREAIEFEPTATTNSACSDCPGRHACPTLQQAAYSDAEFASDRQPHDLTPQAASLELRMLSRALDRLKARVEGLEELTASNLKSGIALPYYHLEPTKPRSQWNVDVDQVVILGQMFGKDLAKPGVITPLQASKKGVDEAVIKKYSYTPVGSMKLVQDNPADVRKVFGSSKQQE